MKFTFFLVSLSSMILSQDLPTLIQIAFDVHPAVASRTHSLEAMKEMKNASGKLDNPTLSGGVFAEPIYTAKGAQQWRVGVSQKIPFIGKLSSKRKIAEKNITFSELSLRKTKLGIQTEVISAYENLRFYYEELKISKEKLKLMQQMEAVINARYKTASAEYPDLIQMQIAIMKQENSIQDLLEDEAILLAALQNAMGIETPPEPPFQQQNLIRTDEISISQNLTFRQKKVKVSMREIEYKLNKLKSFPDFIIGVDYIRLGEDLDSHPLLLKAGISLPLWLKKNKGQEQSAFYRKQSAISDLKELDSELHTRLLNMENHESDQYREYILYQEKLIPHAKLGYEVAETAYLADAIPFTEYMFAYQTLLETELQAAKTVRNFLIQKGKLLEITGKYFTPQSEDR